MESHFYRSFMEGLGFSQQSIPPQDDQSQWEPLKSRVAEIFLTKTRAEWLEVFSALDACVTPVLSLTEAPLHPHNRARGTFVQVGEVVEPAPAPRFSRTPPSVPVPPRPGVHAPDVLLGWGLATPEIGLLLDEGVID